MKRRTLSSFAFFDVTYVDGSRSSNRRVPSSVLEEPDRDAAIMAAIEMQDREISLASGRPQGVIKSVMRSRS